MIMPEGTSDNDGDEDGGMPEDQDEDDPPCTPQDIFRSRTEDLGGDIQTR